MGCERVEMPGGGTAVLCSRGGKGSRPKPCGVAGCERPSVALCDRPVWRGPGQSRTCDAPICEGHRTAIGRDVDLCPPCAAVRERRAEQRGETRVDVAIVAGLLGALVLVALAVGREVASLRGEVSALRTAVIEVCP